MKNHKHFEELIQGYLDKVLEEQEEKDLKNHLKSCESCKVKLKERKKLLKRIRATKDEVSCPDYLIDDILKNTTKKEGLTVIDSSTIRWKYVAVGAAAILIVISSVLFNIENNKQILTVKGSKEIKREEPLKEEIAKSTESPSEKKKEEKLKDVKSTMESTSRDIVKPKAPVPVEVTDFAEAVEIDKEKPTFSKLAEAPASVKKDISRLGEANIYESDSKEEIVLRTALEKDLTDKTIIEKPFEETRFVFPEEGDVVGQDFEIVLILENPGETVEIWLDGEKINYAKIEDSNVIFIVSDSIPPLEEGLHYLSLLTKEEKSITFYKEG